MLRLSIWRRIGSVPIYFGNYGGPGEDELVLHLEKFVREKNLVQQG